jgi:uncharacterized protein DUF5666
MRVLITTGLIAALTAAPIGLLASPQTQSSKKSTTKASTPASHATTGVVKSIDDTTLVITKHGKQSSAMTFVIDPSTQREGSIQVGSSVSVRYHADGKKLIASAIAIQQPKQTASHSAAQKKS